jgi:hypothetical protein
MSTQFLEQCIAEEKIRDRIREFLPDEKRVELNNLFRQFEEMTWAFNAPVLHSIFLAPLATIVIIYLECYFNGIGLKKDFLFLLAISPFLLFLTFKISRCILSSFYQRSAEQIESDILCDFKKNTELWELLWLIRAKSCERDREIATRVMQKLLRETFNNQT